MRNSIPVAGPARIPSPVDVRRRPFPEAVALPRYEETLLREAHHRICNSLQIIASLLALDARRTSSDEARLHLLKAHQRIIAVATVQRQLQETCGSGEIELAPYLRQLCEGLSASIIEDAVRISIDVRADPCAVTSDSAMKLGLVVVELVTNAAKHAFGNGTTNGVIGVTYRIEDRNWRLTVSDNGTGASGGARSDQGGGSGTDIVAALVKRLDAQIETSSRLDPSGLSISICGFRGQDEAH